MLPQIRQAYSTQVDAVQGDAARSHIVQPEQQPGQRRFAAASAAQHAQDVARLEFKRYVVQHVRRAVFSIQ